MHAAIVYVSLRKMLESGIEILSMDPPEVTTSYTFLSSGLNKVIPPEFVVKAVPRDSHLAGSDTVQFDVQVDDTQSIASDASSGFYFLVRG